MLEEGSLQSQINRVPLGCSLWISSKDKGHPGWAVAVAQELKCAEFRFKESDTDALLLGQDHQTIQTALR